MLPSRIRRRVWVWVCVGVCVRVVFLRSVAQLLVTSNVLPCSVVLFTLMMEAIRSYETSLLNNSPTASHSRRRHTSVSLPSASHSPSDIETKAMNNAMAADIFTCSNYLKDTGRGLRANGVLGPAGQSTVVQFRDRRIPQDARRSVASGSEPLRRDL
jgi:hypothetical protein